MQEAIARQHRQTATVRSKGGGKRFGGERQTRKNRASRGIDEDELFVGITEDKPIAIGSVGD